MSYWLQWHLHIKTSDEKWYHIGVVSNVFETNILCVCSFSAMAVANYPLLKGMIKIVNWPMKSKFLPFEMYDDWASIWGNNFIFKWVSECTSPKKKKLSICNNKSQIGLPNLVTLASTQDRSSYFPASILSKNKTQKCRISALSFPVVFLTKEINLKYFWSGEPSCKPWTFFTYIESQTR